MRHYTSLLSIFSLVMGFELGGVLSGNQMGGIPLGVSLGNGELDVEGICTRAGVACRNCTHAVTCINLPNGAYLMVPLNTCSESQTCNANQGGCSDEPVPECDDTTKYFRHICEQVGIFPDAYDCRKFHLCSPPSDLPSGRPADHRTALCPRNYGYNAQTAQCSIKLPFGQCETKPTSDCTTIGQYRVLASSPNYYSVCIKKEGKLFPQIFVCPHGLHFIDGFCRDKREVMADKEKVVEAKQAGSEINRATVSTVPVKVTEYPPDTFLADKFDLSNYETVDDAQYFPQPSIYDFGSSSDESF